MLKLRNDDLFYNLSKNRIKALSHQKLSPLRYILRYFIPFNRKKNLSSQGLNFAKCVLLSKIFSSIVVFFAFFLIKPILSGFLLKQNLSIGSKKFIEL